MRRLAQLFILGKLGNKGQKTGFIGTNNAPDKAMFHVPNGDGKNIPKCRPEHLVSTFETRQFFPRDEEEKEAIKIRNTKKILRQFSPDVLVYETDWTGDEEYMLLIHTSLLRLCKWHHILFQISCL